MLKTLTSAALAAAALTGILAATGSAQAGGYDSYSDNYSTAYVAPTYQAPTYTAPAYQAPAYQAPAYVAPTYQAPAYVAPSYSAPSYGSGY